MTGVTCVTGHYPKTGDPRLRGDDDSNTEQNLFNVRIISPNKKPFACGNNIPVKPDYSMKNAPKADIIILPELWLGPDESVKGRYLERDDLERDALLERSKDR